MMETNTRSVVEPTVKLSCDDINLIKYRKASIPKLEIIPTTKLPDLESDVIILNENFVFQTNRLVGPMLLI